MRDEGTGTSILLETERLFLREMDRNDYDALYRVLADTEIMRLDMDNGEELDNGI